MMRAGRRPASPRRLDDWRASVNRGADAERPASRPSYTPVFGVRRGAGFPLADLSREDRFEAVVGHEGDLLPYKL